MSHHAHPARRHVALRRVRDHWGDRHYRNGYYLMLNSVVGAAAGLLFWLLLKLAYHVSDVDIGKGFAAISLATALALLAKGGLDAALVRHVPRAHRAEGLRLLRLATSAGIVSLAAAMLLLGLAVRVLGFGAQSQDVSLGALAVIGGLAGLLVVTWLQDAHFLAEGEARFSFYRNVVLHGSRLLTPALVVAWALPYPIPVAWGLALTGSVAVAALLARRLPTQRPEVVRGAPLREKVPTREFLRSAARNITGSAAEFLPGLILAPLVYNLEGPAMAAYFGIAWTGASMLFLLSASISRSTFAEMARHGPAEHPRLLRRAVRHHLIIVAPAAVVAMAASPILLRVFGQGYVQHGEVVFLLLAASTVLIGPVYLFLALLRSREDRVVLVAYPAALILALFAITPWFEERLGLAGVGAAWILIHIPLAAFASARLVQAMRGSAMNHADPGEGSVPRPGPPTRASNSRSPPHQSHPASPASPLDNLPSHVEAPAPATPAAAAPAASPPNPGTAGASPGEAAAASRPRASSAPASGAVAAPEAPPAPLAGR